MEYNKAIYPDRCEPYTEMLLNVSDPSPILVLFGPRASGKTMTLVRLTLYLEKMGYQVVPDTLFRPPYDTYYQKICSEFAEICHSMYAPDNSNRINFMLVKVLDKFGNSVCQILKIPGDLCFDPFIGRHNRNDSYKVHECIGKIMDLPNEKVWVFIVEQGGFNGVNIPAISGQDMRDMYVQRIHDMHAHLRRDKVIFTCHKVDMHPEVFLGNGMPNKKQIFKNIKNDYPGIFTPFENKNPITRLFRKYNSQFIPFSAGSFTPTNNGQVLYTMSNDVYPKLLWEAICKSIK